MGKSYIFFCPISHRPTGGVGFIYRVVDYLNSEKINAFVFHQAKNFSCKWLNHGNHIYCGSLNPSIHHLVIPENDVWQFSDFVTENHFSYSIFVQNGFYIPDKISSLIEEDRIKLKMMYKSAQFIFSVSDYSTELIRKFISCDLEIIRIFTTPYLSECLHVIKKRRLISYMSRKNYTTSNRVIFGLSELIDEGWEIIDINSNGPISENKLSDILSKTAIFLSFGTDEGLPAPPLEAANYGCTVVGYHGFGGLEYWKDYPFYLVPEGDIVTFIDEVKKVSKNYNFDSEILSYDSKFSYSYSKITTINTFKKLNPNFSSSVKSINVQTSLLLYRLRIIINYIKKNIKEKIYKSQFL